MSGTLTYSLPARERTDSAGERLERLYGASRDDLYAYLATLLGDHSAAEEVIALARLAPRERELIALKFHAGLSNPDLARVLGVSESNAGTLLHRAITKLRKACDEQA